MIATLFFLTTLPKIYEGQQALQELERLNQTTAKILDANRTALLISGPNVCGVQNYAHLPAGFMYELFTDYDKTIIPMVDAKAVNVNVEVTVQDIPSLSQDSGVFTVDAWYSQYWLDPRLAYSHLDSCRPNISLDYRQVQQLWTPNVCIVNSFDSVVHKSPSENVLGMLFPNGSVWINYRVRIEGPCNIDLHRFPMDSQICELVLESYSYNTDEIRLRWFESSVSFIKAFEDYKIPEFQLVYATSENASYPYSAGHWDQLVVKFQFKRMIGYYVLQAFLPTGMCLSIAWLGFFLPTDAIKARVALGVMALTLLTFTIGNIMAVDHKRPASILKAVPPPFTGLPRSSYLRALDIWIFGCLFFSFLTLIELCTASVVDCYIAEHTRKWRMTRGDMRLLYERNPFITFRTKFLRLYLSPLQWGEQLDFWSMKLFPSTFVVLVACYYLYYVVYSQQEELKKD